MVLDMTRPTHCAICGVSMRRTYNYEHCSPECVLVGEIALDVETHNLMALRDR